MPPPVVPQEHRPAKRIESKYRAHESGRSLRLPEGRRQHDAAVLAGDRARDVGNGGYPSVVAPSLSKAAAVLYAVAPLLLPPSRRRLEAVAAERVEAGRGPVGNRDDDVYYAAYWTTTDGRAQARSRL